MDRDGRLNYMICSQCNLKEVNTKNGSKKYCSVKCFGLSVSGKDNPSYKHGLCKNKTLYIKSWQKANREKMRVSCRAWHHRNKETENLRTLGFRKNNKGYYLQWHKKRLASDPLYRLKVNLRARFVGAFNYQSQGKRERQSNAIKLLGCSIEELKNYLEKKFIAGMTWDNHSLKGWHIDHIRPLSSFDLTEPRQVALACHYSNLQPLWAKDNIRKGKKLVYN